MKILPAIDMKDGKAVRLMQGKFDQVKVYYDTPFEAACQFKEQGVTYLHLVDLDGALVGKPVHHNWVERIVRELGMSVEIGGGIREYEDAKMYLDMGVDRVILGTKAFHSPDLYKKLLHDYAPEKVVVGVDARDGWVAISGWKEVTRTSAIEFIKKLEEDGIKLVIYTDILCDGMLSGPNIESMKTLLENTSINLIASGGVSTLENIQDLLALPQNERVVGAIIGKAIYEKKLDVKDALSLVRNT